ncbi:WYL domain-containing protein [Ferrimicrobium sp.]|uniref:helix-turn-helix transcriptional regulator n=1 Tax=Ferrimicrobium sp. TaxID=2926050 RepID=UPI0026241ED3|nr:WYL domain-containing protein [Ferrimicrobium sp.]
MVSDPLIRLVNLFELLSTTREPLTQEAITDLVPGFPQSPAARARAFERSKSSLREIGIPLRTITLPGRSQVGYQIDAEDIQFDLDLTRAEWAALEAALGCAVFVGQHGRHFETRLGLLYRQAAPIVWEMGELVHLNPDLGRAIAESRRVCFVYRGRERDIFPFGVLMRWGHAYLVADEAGHQKSFRIDRIEPPYVIGPVDEQPRPDDLRSALPAHPWLLEFDQRVDVTLLGPRAQLEALGAVIVGDEPTTITPGEAPHEQVYGRVVVSNVSALLSDLLMEPQPVIPLFPIEIRQRFAHQVQAVLASLDVSLVAGEARFMTSASNALHRTRTNHTLEDRFLAVQGLLSYLRVNGGSSTIAALADVSGLSPREVIELLESASLAGLPPYSPDVLLDVMVDEEFDLVEVSVDTGLGRTQRIDVVEAMTVLATLEAVTSIMDGEVAELQSASTKLRNAIREQLLRSGEVANSDHPPEAVALLRRAIAEPECVELDYTDAEGRASHRHLVAISLFVVAGRWYLFGLADGRQRHFRLDRMRDIVLVASDGCHDASAIRLAQRSLDRLDPLGLRSSGTPTRLRLEPDLVVKLEALTQGVFDRDDEGCVVYSFRDEWLARLLLAIGPGASGTIPSSVLADVRRRGETILAMVDSWVSLTTESSWA